MALAQVGRDAIEWLRQEMCGMVHSFCDNLQRLQGAQRRRARQELENDFDEVMLEAVGRHLQDNDQEFRPLLPELRQELRCRFRKPSVPDPEDEDDPRGHGFCNRELSWFQRMLRRLEQKWQAALAWLRRRAAACWQAVCRAVEAVCSALAGVCACLAQVFRSCTQA